LFFVFLNRPTQNRVLRLIKELGLETYDIYDNGKSLIDVTGKVWFSFFSFS